MIEPIFSRRQTLCENFVKKVIKQDSHNLIHERKVNRSLIGSRKYQEYTSHNQCSFDNPLIALTRFANKLK